MEKIINILLNVQVKYIYIQKTKSPIRTSAAYFFETASEMENIKTYKQNRKIQKMALAVQLKKNENIKIQTRYKKRFPQD